VQRAEVRFDIAGCLRTPAGGSSRQTLLIATPEGEVRARLLSAREAARLMGLPEDYRLPARYNAAYKLAGDGVAVPVARWIAERMVAPLLGDRRP
jgi:DNA (cytosine-5)-methyltransferase 1